jgi:hypothetical protein
MLRGLFSMILLTACGGGDDAADATVSFDAPAAADAGPPDAPPTVSITGQIIDYVTMNTVADMTVSVVEHPEVTPVLSDATGGYVVQGVPAGALVTLRFEKETYMPQVSRAIQLGASDYVMYEGRGFDAVVTRAAVDLIGDIIGVPHDPARGALVVRLEDGTSLQGLAAAVADLQPVTGSPPVYFNSGSFPDPALTETSTAGIALFHDYDPGPQTVTFTHATHTACAAVGDDAPPAPYLATVYPDTVTWIPFECSPP